MTPLQNHQAVLSLALELMQECDFDPAAYVALCHEEFDDEEVRSLLLAAAYNPALTLREKQKMPGGDWYIWLLRTGRGFGKNHAASCAINMLAEYEFPGKQGLVVGATFKDVRSTIYGGESGILAMSRPGFEPTIKEHTAEIVWPNGSRAAIRTGDNPQDIRGLSVPWAYCDELIKWKGAKKSWDNIVNCVRETDQPRIIVTSTPLRGAEWLKLIEARDDTHLTTGRTIENTHLATTFVKGQKHLDAKGFREESDGEWVSDGGSLWSRDQIDQVTVAPQVSLEKFAATLDERAISLDPSGGKRDLTGISLLGVQGDLKWVLGDFTLDQPVKQATWIAEVKLIAARYLKPGDRIIVETNGASGLDETLQEHFPDHYVERVYHAGKDTKLVRAEKAQVLYEQGLVRHFTPMLRLEQQMVDFYDVVNSNHESPDRVDAMVTGLNFLHEAPPPITNISVMNMGTSFGF